MTTGRRSDMDKRTELLALVKLRKATRWPAYKCIGDYQKGAYECDFVSPYTKTAGNVDAEIMVMLQDWASDDGLGGPFHEPSATLGHDPSRSTNKNLTKLLDMTFGLTLQDTYGTNLFPFVKLGRMSAPIPQEDLIAAALQFALPQILIVKPKLVICLGLVTFKALRQVCHLNPSLDLHSAIESPFNIGTTRVWCQAHTGRLSNRGTFERVLADWRRMKDDVYGTKVYRQNDQPRRQMTNSATRKDITGAPGPTRSSNMVRPLTTKENKMKIDQAERESGRPTARELIVCLNNSVGKNHAYLYGENAFFDLWPTDRQACHARDLKVGQTCIVAQPESYGDVSFSWFEFSRREDGQYEEKPCWVFYGDLIKPPVKLQKAVAARTEPYSIFFNVDRHFKRQNVLRTWY
jgi:uracil-DNA glycosylase